jgi:hypothetical protein
MRKLLLIFAVLLIASMAQAGWYPQALNTGSVAQSHGGGTDYLFTAVNQTIAAAESTDTDQIKAASVNSFNSTTHFLMRSSGVGSSAFLAQPDVPRNIIATMNTSTTGSLKLTGTDISGVAITENLTWTGETGAKSSTKAFKTVTRVDGTCTTNTAQFILGTGDLLGLNQYLALNTVLACYLDGTREANAPTVTTDVHTLSLNTIDTSGAPGGHVTSVLMLVPA